VSGRDWIALIADRRIDAAVAKGELSGLPGEGKPLDRARLAESMDDSLSRIMAEAGALPEEFVWRKKIDAARAMLDGIDEPAARRRAMAEIALMEMRHGIASDARRRFMRG
jgi:hypothetical protein